ncbi:MAG: hypothetical protein Q8N77_03965 [Nanoarchaeota archaeon]|nr:hypothetical protein [Nanoarchaeota archaeon]
MGIERAKCDNCGFEQKHIFIYGFSGIGFRLKYACLKCTKIVTHEGKIEDCPKCGSKLIKLYEEDFKDHYHTCPKCGEKKLKFYLEART